MSCRGDTIAKGTRFFHIVFALILTAHNICWTPITASISISAYALGYILSIRIEFVMRNMMSICVFCCKWNGGLNSTTSRKLKNTNKSAYFQRNIILTYAPKWTSAGRKDVISLPRNRAMCNRLQVNII